MKLKKIIRRLTQFSVLVLTAGIILLIPVIHLIPYVNIYSKEVIFVLACMDMLLCFFLFHITLKHVLIALAALLSLMYILHVFKQMEEAEYVGNMIYFLLCIGFIKEFIKPTQDD